MKDKIALKSIFKAIVRNIRIAPLFLNDRNWSSQLAALKKTLISLSSRTITP